MKKEILKTFDLFIENADTKELKELIKEIKELYKENERLHSIIKEVREEIEYFELQANHLDDSIYLDETLTKKLLEILDKVDKENTCTNCGQENE